MFRLKDQVIEAVVKFLSAISASLARPAFQRIPVRMNYPSLSRRRK